LALKTDFTIYGVVLGEFIMRLFTRFFLLIAAFLGTISAYAAGEIPGYIGNQSFRLSDDRELGDMVRRAEDAKIELARAEQGQRQLADQLKVLENQKRSLDERSAALQKEIETLSTGRKALAGNLEVLKQQPEVNAAAIATTTAEIERIDAEIAEKSRQAGALKLESAPLNVRIDQIRNDFNQSARRTEDARQRMQNAGRNQEQYRNDLIVAVKRINVEGARVGQSDGAMDGADLSAKMAYDRGTVDGRYDGQQRGTSDGQARYYRVGSEQGDREGSSRATIDGNRDGTNEGAINGNKSAGSREGRVAGIKRGDASPAAAVGTEQGKKAGMARAVSTGQADGRNIGESETTKKLESGELKSVNLNGSFAGSFERRSPQYSGDFNGPNYKPRINHSKEIMVKAFADGYNFNYRQYARFEFQRRIDADYNSYYDQNYRIAYDSAVGREYPAYFDQGRRDGDAQAYSRTYPIVRAEAYKMAFEKLDSTPSRSSAEYKASFTESELFAFNQRYEDIRNANFDRFEKDTFSANIAAQTETYRQKRTAEVNAIYNNNAILEFVSSDMLDGGIKGVALLDGVFQPGETTNHNVVLRNFGFKSATNVSVQLENGQAVKLPEIPARSLVIVKGATQSAVNASLGSVYRSSLNVVSPLVTNDAVEGRFYDKAANGLVKLGDQKAVRIAYPLSLAGLSLDSQLLKGSKNKLKMTLTNNSKREYKGELKIKLLANSQNAIITKGFASVAAVGSSVSLTDAEILVTDEQDVYRDLSISATVEQNGVLIGILPQDLVVMAKAPYIEKAKLPVIVANTDRNIDTFVEALSAAGGTDKVSVLDLSLASLNAAPIANGLSGKVVVLVDNSDSTSIKTLNSFLAKSKTSAFLMVDDSNLGLKNIKSMGSLKDAASLLFGKRRMYFSNQHRAAEVVKSSAFIQSSVNALSSDLVLAQKFIVSGAELIADLKVTMTPEFFTTPNETMKIFSLRSLAEVVNINSAYDESGGIFSRDKKWAKMIEEDGGLFHNQMKAASKGGVVTSKLPIILSAIALRDTVKTAMSSADGVSGDMKLKIKNATNGVLDDMEDSFKKSLKKDFGALYNKAYDNASVHRPFAID
jgi:uncharacterized small protein (DUF1192 family)